MGNKPAPLDNGANAGERLSVSKKPAIPLMMTATDILMNPLSSNAESLILENADLEKKHAV